MKIIRQNTINTRQQTAAATSRQASFLDSGKPSSRRLFRLLLSFSVLLITGSVIGQKDHLQADEQSADQPDKYPLNTGWFCKKATELPRDGAAAKWKEAGVRLKGWLPATVPGTILTTLLNNHKIPDPYYGMNNKKIPDINETGKDFYTYWFVRDFDEQPTANDQQLWLHFRGVNYGFDVYLNGHKLNKEVQKGMFLRRTFNITPFLSPTGHNRLAVLVYPPDVVGAPNGGQGGDGTIARNVMHQYVAGWDWIQPIHDRNTGIWDKVWLEKTGAVRLLEPHVVTLVPGKRWPDDTAQQPVVIQSSTRLENISGHAIEGLLTFTMDGHVERQKIQLDAHSAREIRFPDLRLEHPRLWWPNGMGNDGLRPLYPVQFRFQTEDGSLSDQTALSVGLRELKNHWNEKTSSMEVLVNGQKVFIRGGNWIVSDAMLRLSKARYDAEIRFHRDMRLNLIRVWGGALTERPEFYQACDRYGLLVMQDFWGSGDCNGRWEDPKKKDDIWTRRQYPDDHHLFMASAADQIKMLRNHASLAIWCGGNEITLPPDLQHGLQDSLLPMLDTTRWYIDFSNSDSMSFNTLGGNGDGPYGIQPLSAFWSHRTYPFNSEVGSVGVGDAISLKRILPPQNQVVPHEGATEHSMELDSVWAYHKYIGYGNTISRYGQPKNMEEFARMAQLVNYNQYRSMMEGFTSHQWDWYTGFIIWKTQNPWTALRGQMYDYYLDPNACLYGLRDGGQKLHLMYDLADSSVYILNNGYTTARNLMMVIQACDMQGKVTTLTRTITQAVPQRSKMLMQVGPAVRKLAAAEGIFLSLRLLNLDKKVVSENTYWLPDAQGQYSGLQSMPASRLTITASVRKTPAAPEDTGKRDSSGQQQAGLRIEIRLHNPAGAPPAFFNRCSVIDRQTGERLLPSFYSDNYVTLLPGTDKTIWVDPPSENAVENSGETGMKKKNGLATYISRLAISVEGWNLPYKVIRLDQ